MLVRRHFHAHEPHLPHAFMRALAVILMMIVLLILAMWIVSLRYAQAVARTEPMLLTPKSRAIPLQSLPGHTPVGIISQGCTLAEGQFHTNS